MFKIHDDMITTTNELIKQTHVCQEKKIQILEKEILHKDVMNMVMQEVLIKVIWSAQHFMDTLNHKFDEMLLILEETLYHIKAQSPNVEAYYSFSKQINMSFQRVFN